MLESEQEESLITPATIEETKKKVEELQHSIGNTLQSVNTAINKTAEQLKIYGVTVEEIPQQ